MPGSRIRRTLTLRNAIIQLEIVTGQSLEAHGRRNHDKHRGKWNASMTIRVERDGPVTTVILDRPDVRNAVDGPTAAALAGAFRAFDAVDGAHVAVL
jgi:hypothetical protein